jgi:hypothetical protein
MGAKKPLRDRCCSSSAMVNCVGNMLVISDSVKAIGHFGINQLQFATANRTNPMIILKTTSTQQYL